MNIIRNVWIPFCFFLLSFTASANIIFTFAVDDLREFSVNATVGDSFSLAFNNDTNFITGISWNDIAWVSYDTTSVGSMMLESFDYAYDDGQIADFLTFTDLGNNSWQLDILVGRTGIDTNILFMSGLNYIQFGQTINGSGWTNLYIESDGNHMLVHDSSNEFLFSAISTSVAEPSALAFLGLGILMLRVRRKFSSPV